MPGGFVSAALGPGLLGAGLVGLGFLIIGTVDRGPCIAIPVRSGPRLARLVRP
jgi:hypothetical protein